MRTAVRSIALAALVTLAACNAEAPPAHAPAPAVPAAPAITPLPSTTRDATATSEPSGGKTPAFVDIPWKVSGAGGGQAGAVYTFGSDGQLTIDAPGGTPSTGRWSYTGGKLTMVEDGVAYPTDIVSLDATHFVIRSHNPGGTVEISMSAAR